MDTMMNLNNDWQRQSTSDDFSARSQSLAFSLMSVIFKFYRAISYHTIYRIISIGCHFSFDILKLPTEHTEKLISFSLLPSTNCFLYSFLPSFLPSLARFLSSSLKRFICFNTYFKLKLSSECFSFAESWS